MLSDLDKDAVFALLVRQITAQNQREEARAAMKKAKEELDNANQTIAKLKSGFAIFGFEGENIWGDLRAAVGDEIVSKAFEVAKDGISIEQAKRRVLIEGHPSQSGEDGAEPEYEPLDGQEGAPSPKIREIVFGRLKQAGEQGTKVREIKQFIAEQGIEIHDKTVGMTLYRLSKEGLARRDGRVWFAVEKHNGLFDE